MKEEKVSQMKKHKKESRHRRHDDDDGKIIEDHHYRSVVKKSDYKKINDNYYYSKRKSSREEFHEHSHSKYYKHERENLQPDYHKQSSRYNRKRNRSSSKESEERVPHHRKKYPGKQGHSNESYEELSRRKRKIESELHALDMEEAAQQAAKSKRRSKRDSTYVVIKEEPLSDDSRGKPIRKPVHEQQWGRREQEKKKSNKPKEKPNFNVSGKLAEDTNTYNGVVIKYNEPKEARKPRRKWRLYPFKGDNPLPFIPIHRQSAYLFGRTRLIADIPIDHPSCSKQHAVLQFRLVSYQHEDGRTLKRVRPYIIDLESSNGTYVNNKKIDSRCYVELLEKDVIKFGFSSREYVILHEESKNENEDDDVKEEKCEK